MFITLDHNCIIALENPLRPSEADNAHALKELVALCKSHQIHVVVDRTMAMENPLPGTDSQDLKTRLEAVGLEDVEIREQRTLWFDIGGIATADVGTEVGFMVWVHQCMFPNIAFRFYDYVEAECKKQGIDYKAFMDANRDKRLFTPPLIEEELADPTTQQLREQWRKWHRKWNNAKMDALSICAHLSWGDGIFVTNNTTDFQRRTQMLRRRAPALKILTPTEAVIAIRELALSKAEG